MNVFEATQRVSCEEDGWMRGIFVSAGMTRVAGETFCRAGFFFLR